MLRRRSSLPRSGWLRGPWLEPGRFSILLLCAPDPRDWKEGGRRSRILGCLRRPSGASGTARLVARGRDAVGCKTEGGGGDDGPSSLLVRGRLMLWLQFWIGDGGRKKSKQIKNYNN